jgi:hypothetical protein
MKNKTLILFLLALSVLSQAQYKPKRIKSKNDFIQKKTNTVFPLRIDNLLRKNIYAFNRKKTNIGVSYEDIESHTLASIYIYPANAGTEDRLRIEYLKSLQSIASVSDDGVFATQYYVSYSDSAYKINGFKSEIENNEDYSSLVVYECGCWFFKIRITSEELDSLTCNQIESRLLNFFKPTKLVQISHLNPKSSIYVAKNALIDSLMLNSVLSAAFAKSKWALDNVDSLERASGFPGLYLDLHIESINAFVNYEKEHPDLNKTERTADYLSELNSIIDNDFLEEFLMDQYDMIMIVPDNLEFDFEAYESWKLQNPLTINLNKMLYVIIYNKK